MGRIVWRKFYFLVPTTDVADLALTSVWNSFSPCFELEASTFTATTSPVAIVALYTGPNDPCPKIVVKLCVAFWISLEKHKALDKVLIIACESDKKKKKPSFYVMSSTSDIVLVPDNFYKTHITFTVMYDYSAVLWLLTAQPCGLSMSNPCI